MLCGIAHRCDSKADIDAALAHFVECRADYLARETLSMLSRFAVWVWCEAHASSLGHAVARHVALKQAIERGWFVVLWPDDDCLDEKW